MVVVDEALLVEHCMQDMIVVIKGSKVIGLSTLVEFSLKVR